MTLVRRLAPNLQTPCWEWPLVPTTKGYGLYRVGQGKYQVAHRYVYERLVGLVPDGLELDHLCRNKRCVNPCHLEAVTHQVNTDRGRICQAGHPKTPENRTGGKRSRCRPCWNAYVRNRNHRQKAA